MAKVYRLDFYIALQADRERKSIKQVSEELRQTLGISRQSFSMLRNKEAVKGGRISCHLLKISQFFQVPIDDLIDSEVKAGLLVKSEEE